MVDDPQTWGTSDNIGYKTQTEDKLNKTDRQQHHRLNPFARKGKSVPIYCKIPAV